MILVDESTVIDHPIAEVWSLIRDFNGHTHWHPAVQQSHMADGKVPDSIGGVRDFKLVSGERVSERLIKLSDKHHQFSYTITEAEIPLYDYVAHVQLKAVTQSGQTFWRWWSRFNTPAGQESELKKLVAEGVYHAGFAGVREYLAKRHSSSTVTNTTTTLSQPSLKRESFNRASLPATDNTSQSSISGNLADLPGEAVQVTAFGDASMLEPISIHAPAPRRGEVRLQHHAVGVNYIDVYTRSGYFKMIDPPAIPGMEAAGTVLDVGDTVKHLREGDRVSYACAPPGAYASIRTMPAEHVVAIPEHISFEAAAALSLKGVTAYFLLHKVHQLKASDTVLVFAPAGGVGRLLVQWASSLGATVIGATSSTEKVSLAKSAGAEHVLVPGEQSLEDQVLALTGGIGVDVIYDAVGRDSFTHSIAALKNCGHLVSYGQASGDIGARDIGSMAARSLTLSRPNYGHYTDTADKMSEALQAVWAALDQNIISCEIGQRFPLVAAAQAHEALESRTTTGSTILVPSNSGEIST